MKVKQAQLYQIDLPLRTPFQTSAVYMTAKKTIILALTDVNGEVGYGECAALEFPYYSEEFRVGAWELLKNQLLPLIVGHEIEHPDESDYILQHFRKNKMAKSAINSALWDLYAKQRGQTLANALGGNKSRVETGVSIGIQESPEKLVNTVQNYLNEGYRRIKVKIRPGKDVEYLRSVRERFPDITLTADANSAYRLTDLNLLKQLDDLDLQMIEQPLEPGDLIDHAELQSQLKTPLCLDESIVELADVRKMAKIGSGRIINIKVSRVGGLTTAKKIQQYAHEHGIACWGGGMLDAGVQRAQDIAAATLPGYTLANDIAPSSRYFAQDIIKPMVELDGTYVNVPDQTGMGFDINWDNLNQFTVQTAEVK
ncbi:MAG: o-succinylbenzoate synthase [Lactobacillus sp.]|uniref:o-succinylbenzoate synthase n=1 Tax=Limosilactobacillus coleohominis TaxID=181675 RepID=UPI002A920BA1|nr:o-succinylbenzoate synthase [Limosilactobacillus coleohominis]MCI5813157.1 o-succinylbenzoate synthase [Lactobacillus sp.]MDY5628126.1 o-succinylbenzoate synthase [Limosilactobacillus coleohominis]